MGNVRMCGLSYMCCCGMAQCCLIKVKTAVYYLIKAKTIATHTHSQKYAHKHAHRLYRCVHGNLYIHSTMNSVHMCGLLSCVAVGWLNAVLLRSKQQCTIYSKQKSTHTHSQKYAHKHAHRRDAYMEIYTQHHE